MERSRQTEIVCIEWLILQHALGETYLRWFRFGLTLICYSLPSFIRTTPIYALMHGARERKRKKDALRQTRSHSVMPDSTWKICLNWHWRALKMTGYSYTLRGHEQGNGVMMVRDGYWWHNEERMAEEWCLISHFYISRCRRLASIILGATVETSAGLFFFFNPNPTWSHVLLTDITRSCASFFPCTWSQFFFQLAPEHFLWSSDFILCELFW